MNEHKRFIMFSISESAWRGATIGLIIFSLAVLMAEIYDELAGPGVLLYGTGASFIGALIIAFLALLAVALVRMIAKFPWYYQAALAAALIVTDFVLPAASFLAFVWTFIVIVICPSLLGGSLASFWAGSRRPLTYACMAISGVVLCGVAFWLFNSGTPDAISMSTVNTERAPLALSNPSSPGPYQVKTVFYGNGKDYYRPHFGKEVDITTEPVDGTPFVSGWSGWTGWFRTYFWGFDASAMPLNGQVWHPVGKGPFPLVLMVHGNHSMSTFSDTGYSYLGNLLASQGFITVSIDENFLNTNFFDTWSDFVEVAARGWILLKHLSLWKEWNETPGHLFFQQVDMENIGLVGHSRGGEAIVTATAFNPLPFFPDDGKVAFDFHFSIKALAAIAPKDGQYLPTGNPTPLENINYFVMHGSHDGDVRSFDGSKTYTRLTFNDDRYWFKSALYIVDANHGQFNEVWDRIDTTMPQSLFLNLDPLLTNVQQHQIAEVFLSAYFKSTLKGMKEYIPLFWDARLGLAWLPRTQYLTQFEDSNTEFVYAGKKDLDLTKGTLPGVSISQEGLTLWNQKAVSLKWGDKLDNAIYAGWTNGHGSLTVTLPPHDALQIEPNSLLTFSLADAQENPDPQGDIFVPWLDWIDFSVILADGKGNTASLPLSHDSYLYPQVPTEVYKANFLDTVDNSEVVFQTFRFPLADFIKENPNIDVKDLQSISFRFNRTPYGVVIIDRIGFQPKK